MRKRTQEEEEEDGSEIRQKRVRSGRDNVDRRNCPPSGTDELSSLNNISVAPDGTISESKRSLQSSKNVDTGTSETIREERGDGGRAVGMKNDEVEEKANKEICFGTVCVTCLSHVMPTVN